MKSGGVFWLQHWYAVSFTASTEFNSGHVEAENTITPRTNGYTGQR